MEEEKTLAQINPNIPEQSTPEKSTSSVEVSLSENLNDQQLSRQIHKTASILESFGNISDEYLVRYDVDDKMKALVHKLRGVTVLCIIPKLLHLLYCQCRWCCEFIG